MSSIHQDSAATNSATLGHLPVLLGRSDRPSFVQQDLPVLLGRRPTSAQTLPSSRSLVLTADEADLVPRRRARARFGTARSLAIGGVASDPVSNLAPASPALLRPPRVVLSSSNGVQSMCLLHDRSSRSQFVVAGLPAGPILPEREGCAICFEQFQVDDRVQLMANCRHVFHRACIESFLRSHFPECLVTDCVSCPLCRGPLLAASLAQIPVRERPLATKLDSAWAHFGMTNSTIDNESGPLVCDAIAPVQISESKARTQAPKGPLKRSETVPLGDSGNPKPSLARRAATGPLDTPEEEESLLPLANA